MKKKLLVIVIVLSLFAMTGCGSNNGGGILNSKKTLTCTKEEVDEDGYKTSSTMEVTYNSSKVLKVKSTSVSETDPEYVDMVLGFGTSLVETLNGLDGISASYSKVNDNAIKMVLEVEYDKLDPEQMKEVLGDDYSEDSLYEKNNYTIDEFKDNNLEGYTCK